MTMLHISAISLKANSAETDALVCGAKMRFLYTDFNLVSRVYKMYNHDKVLF